MRIRLPDIEANKLSALLRASGKRLSASAWMRGAVRLAADDPDVAEKISAAAPYTGHGGVRPGAGRPRVSGGRRATDEEGEDADVHEDHPRD